MNQISKFVLSNSVLLACDIGMNMNLVLFYLDSDHYHPKWAVLTLAWMFTPFAIRVGKFFYDLVKTRKAGWFELFIHVPFVQPLRNLCLTWKLYEFRFGFEDFDPRNWVKVTLNSNKVKGTLSWNLFDFKSILREISSGRKKILWSIIIYFLEISSLRWRESRRRWQKVCLSFSVFANKYFFKHGWRSRIITAVRSASPRSQ